MKRRWRILVAVLVAFVLCALGLLVFIPTAPPSPLSIRISGVATNTTPNGSVWRVEVPKPSSKKDAVLFWTVWIQETNRGNLVPQTIALSHEENDILNWPISETESGILSWSGPKLDSNQVYRVLGAFHEPAGSDWQARLYKSPLRPFLRFIPPPKPRLATSEWFAVKMLTNTFQVNSPDQ